MFWPAEFPAESVIPALNPCSTGLPAVRGVRIVTFFLIAPSDLTAQPCSGQIRSPPVRPFKDSLLMTTRFVAVDRSGMHTANPR